MSSDPGARELVLDGPSCRADMTSRRTKLGLTASTPLEDRCMAEHSAVLEPGATELATGEVVAQKGL
jgi:hypothetical protein